MESDERDNEGTPLTPILTIDDEGKVMMTYRRIERRATLLDFDPEADVTAQIIAAIKLTQGETRIVEEPIPWETLPTRGTSFPAGCRLFLPESTEIRCEHTPRCQWTDFVFVYERRMAVVAFRDMAFVSMGTIMKQLRRA